MTSWAAMVVAMYMIAQYSTDSVSLMLSLYKNSDKTNVDNILNVPRIDMSSPGKFTLIEHLLQLFKHKCVERDINISESTVIISVSRENEC